MDYESMADMMLQVKGLPASATGAHSAFAQDAFLVAVA